MVVVAACIATAACANAPKVEPAQEGARSTRRANNVITQQELEESTARDAYQAVQMLRPDWLRTRGATSIRDATASEAVVYLDGLRYGPPRSLEQFRVSTIKELRHYSGTEATNRWGTGHGGGVIYVTSR